MKLFYSTLLLLALLLSSCHYRFDSGELAQHFSTVSIPYAEGDEDGDLTTQLIRTLSTSSSLRYQPKDGDLILKVKIAELRDENIGFNYDRKRHGELRKYLIPKETRLNAVVELTVVEAKTGEIIRGPTRIWGSVDFDHDYYSSRRAANIISLGQLNDIDAAKDIAIHPLNRVLAEKIVDYLNNSW